MPTRRVKTQPRRSGISDEAIVAWRSGDYHALHQALGLRPWMVSPLDVTDGCGA